MPLARLGSSLVYFAHIPKTGGTSIETYLRARGRLALHNNRGKKFLACSPQHIHADLFKALFGKAFCDFSFAVLRDPVARFQSEYRHRAKRAEEAGREIQPFDIWAPHVLKRALDDPFLFDNHLRPQSEFVVPDMRLFRLENGLDAVFDWLDRIGEATAPGPREWRRNLTHVEVAMSGETEALIREFYAADCQLWADTAP